MIGTVKLAMEIFPLPLTLIYMVLTAVVIMVEVESLPSAFIFSPSRSTVNEGMTTTTGATVPLELQIPQHLLQPRQLLAELAHQPLT